MPNTTNRNYSTPITGTEVGTWGDVLNSNFALIDNNLGGVASVAVSNVNVTLNSSQYQCGTIRLSGALSANIVITFPAVQAWWCIDNQTTGAFTAALWIGSGQVICVEQGTTADVLSDGTNMKFRNLPPVGTYLDICDATVPAWITACTVPPYLACDGSTFSAVTYPYLNTKLGGTTLPDSRGRARFMLNGGTGRLTSAAGGVDGNTRFSSGGSQITTLARSDLPNTSVTVTITEPNGGLGHLHNFVAVRIAGSGGTTSTGGSSLTEPTSQTAYATTGITAAFNLNGSVTQTTPSNVPPAYIGGITLIRAA